MEFFNLLLAELKKAERSNQVLQKRLSCNSYYRSAISSKISEKLKAYSSEDSDMENVLSKILREVPDDVESIVDDIKIARIRSSEKVETLRSTLENLQAIRKDQVEKDIQSEAAKKEVPRKIQEKPVDKVKRRRRKKEPADEQ